MSSILVIHGPNLNLLGSREPYYYGQTDLTTINQRLISTATMAGHTLDTFQSNAEHALIERIHRAKQEQCNLIIINPAAFTHTSVAIRDALLGVGIPFIEVHLSNIFARESFRSHSYFSDIAIGVISGLGTESYSLALRYAHHYLTRLGVEKPYGLTQN